MARACLIALALLPFVAVACKTAPSCPVQTRTDPAKALEDHAARQTGWQAIKAEARVTQWADRGRIRGTVLMFLERPSRVRFDVMTQVGPAAVLTSDGEQFQLSDLREGVFLHGPTCPENIARLLGISVNAENVLRLLTGDTPMLEASDQKMECREGRYVVMLTAADGSTQEIAFSINEQDRDQPPAAQRLTLRRSSVRDPDGALRWEASYDDYTTIEGRSFPRSVRFIDKVNDADTSVRVKSIALNPTVPDEAFEQAPGSGMTTEFAPCP